jgi:HAD superfamily hydrolase (TIGR01490 family)
MPTAAFFDLDGTLLTVNSANLWVKRELRLGNLPLWKFLRAALWLGGYRLGMLDMDAALTAALTQLKGIEEAKVRAQTQAWWCEEVRGYFAPGARAILQAHKDAGDLCVLITSSSRYAAEMAREDFALDHVIFQGYETADGRFTGKATHPLCYGQGKVLLAEAWAREAGVDVTQSAFYSDSYTDLPLLEKVAKPFAVAPDLRLGRLARQRGWPVLDWSKEARGAGAATTKVNDR